MTRSEPPAEVIEAVAQAMYELRPIGVREWRDCPTREASGLREQARAAISAYEDLLLRDFDTALDGAKQTVASRGEATTSPSLRASSSLGGIEGGVARAEDSAPHPDERCIEGKQALEALRKLDGVLDFHDGPAGIAEMALRLGIEDPSGLEEGFAAAAEALDMEASGGTYSPAPSPAGALTAEKVGRPSCHCLTYCLEEAGAQCKRELERLEKRP